MACAATSSCGRSPPIRWRSPTTVRSKPRTARRTFEIERLRPQGEFLVAHLKGVPDRNAAETLRNVELYVSRDKFPDIDEGDEFYIADLVGLTACDSARRNARRNRRGA